MAIVHKNANSKCGVQGVTDGSAAEFEQEALVAKPIKQNFQ